MGQQQLLLIVLGVIIVGIAIAVGISMFRTNAVSANRDAVINDVQNLAATAQQFWRKPLSMAGGGQSFGNFYITNINDTDGNGRFYLDPTAIAMTSTAYIALPVGDTIEAAGTLNTVYIVGRGTELGKDGSDPVEVFDSVGAINTHVVVLN